LNTLAFLHSADVENLKEDYRQRWDIEVLFKNLKTNGFNIEDTSVTCPKKLITLLHVVMITAALVIKKAIKISKNLISASLQKEAEKKNLLTQNIPKKFPLRESFFKKALIDLIYKSPIKK
jgi:hypothetical protein